jgi:ABC-type bacteriocin/lantibiotic exporter with double-glycine peptidase domain
MTMLQKLNQDPLYYIDPEHGLVKESLNIFEKKWLAVNLLTEASEKSKERRKRRHELFLR